jgi:hypothetical protein
LAPVEPPDLADAQLRVPEHVVFRTFDAETVVLNLDSGQYHGLNGTAGRMLELLGENGSVNATASVVAAEFGQQLDRVTDDLMGLCRNLLDRGLLEVVGADSG